QEVVHGDQLGRILVGGRIDGLSDGALFDGQDAATLIHDRVQGDDPLVQWMSPASDVAFVLQTVDQRADSAGAQVHQLCKLSRGQGVELHDVFQGLEVI